ncbi:MAG: phenylacetate--CoA ligase family protein [Candidatus Anammoximicrobium sp.]|nr:phenylacetate--CoA ligase family protein [Candidatus Anammoximicrobium sp.]
MWLDACLPFWKLRLIRNQRLARQSLLCRNRQRFAQLVAYVARRSPYYARIIRERGIVPERARPEDFPILTKSDLIEHFDEIVTEPNLTRERIERFLATSRDPRDLLDGRYVVVHSSGTSGQLTLCAYTLREWTQGWISLFRVLPFLGPLPRRTAFVGATNGHFASVSLVSTAHWLTIRHFHRTHLFDINRPWQEIIDGLNEYRPHNLSCYGSILGMLAIEQERNNLRIRPRHILCGGDPLLAHDRERAERVFRAPVSDVYATTETMVLGLSEPRRKGLLLLEDDLCIEVEQDRLLVTSLRHHLMPLIRYALSDSVILAPQEEPRQYRGFRRIERLAGRREDNLDLVNERGVQDFIHPLLLVEFYVPGIDRFQVRRTSLTSLVFRVKPRGNLTPAELNRLLRDVRQRWREILAQKHMQNVRYDVELTDELPVDARTGKFRLVVGSTAKAA